MTSIGVSRPRSARICSVASPMTNKRTLIRSSTGFSKEILPFSLPADNQPDLSRAGQTSSAAAVAPILVPLLSSMKRTPLS